MKKEEKYIYIYKYVKVGGYTTIKKKKEETRGLFRQRNSGNRNGGTIKKYDRALIDVKTATLTFNRSFGGNNLAEIEEALLLFFLSFQGWKRFVRLDNYL